MSVHLIPHTMVEPIVARAAVAMPNANIVIGVPDGNGNTPLTVTPNLTAPQVTTLANWVVEEQSGVPGITAADVDLVRAYVAIPNGNATNAQTAAVVKAIARTLRSVIKDL